MSQENARPASSTRTHSIRLLRKKLVSEHGFFKVLDYEEVHVPQYLLSAYGYGDLLHWGRKRDVVAAFEANELSAAEQRSAFLAAAIGLAHIYMGFAVLARAATGK